MVCLLDTATFFSARAKCSVVLNSVMEHAQPGKKPKKMTVILDTRILTMAKRNEKIPHVVKITYIHAIRLQHADLK